MSNKIIHVEVVGKDGEKLQKFYSDVFGWSLDTNNPGGYGMLRQDELHRRHRCSLRRRVRPRDLLHRGR